MTRRIHRDEQGVAIIEMALSLPILITMIYGIFTLGQLFEANAGMQHALGEGARYGTLCTSLSVSGTTTMCTLPSDTEIRDTITSKLFGTASGTFDTPTVDSSTSPSGYKTITVTYHQTMNFLLFTGPTITATRSKRVYLAANGVCTTTNGVTTCT
jgi:Flp pilus assembly protein TadG